VSADVAHKIHLSSPAKSSALSLLRSCIFAQRIKTLNGVKAGAYANERQTNKRTSLIRRVYRIKEAMQGKERKGAHTLDFPGTPGPLGAFIFHLK